MDIYLAIPTMHQGLLIDTLRHADENAELDPRALIHANGLYIDWSDDQLREATHGFMGLYQSASEKNIGVVPALQKLYDLHKDVGHDDDLIAYLHDDVHIMEYGWDDQLIDFFQEHPRVGLVGFFGGRRLGTDALYKDEYDYRQLARGDCFSNMRDAEIHGQRLTQPIQVATVDGFSMICRRSFLDEIGGWKWWPSHLPHHSYDNALACMARRHGWQVWMYPIAVHHLGGRTSTRVDFVKDFGKTETDIHRKGHVHLYEEFRDVLPITI